MDDLKTVIESALSGLKEHPTAGQGTAVTRTVIRSGVTCDVEDGHWKLIADEMPGDGGAGLGPDPGVFGRAALGSCLAMGYVMWAAHLDIPIEACEVVVEADYDARGMLGLDDSIPAGWTDLRYKVTIKSPASPERIREMVEFADRHSSILDFYRRPHEITRQLIITP
ncbi:MAG TPA: OsmC family protein [Dehalococcoidia bacterium]|nr:OsmC family protein [Dehalococcoidia bacterium]